MDPRVVANQPVDNTPVPLLSTGPLGTRRSPYALRTLDTPFTGHIWCCLTPPRRQHACRVPHHAPARPVFARGYRRPNVCISALIRSHAWRGGSVGGIASSSWSTMAAMTFAWGVFCRSGQCDHCTASKSPGFQRPSKAGPSGPYRRNQANQPLPGMVLIHCFSLPVGALGPK